MILLIIGPAQSSHSEPDPHSLSDPIDERQSGVLAPSSQSYPIDEGESGVSGIYQYSQKLSQKLGTALSSHSHRIDKGESGVSGIHQYSQNLSEKLGTSFAEKLLSKVGSQSNF